MPGKNDSQKFRAILDQIDRATDPALGIHVVLTTVPVTARRSRRRGSRRTRAGLRTSRRRTPTGSTKSNSLFFSILQRKVIKNGNFTSRDDLITKMLTYIAE